MVRLSPRPLGWVFWTVQWRCTGREGEGEEEREGEEEGEGEEEREGEGEEEREGEGGSVGEVAGMAKGSDVQNHCLCNYNPFRAKYYSFYC